MKGKIRLHISVSFCILSSDSKGLLLQQNWAPSASFLMKSFSELSLLFPLYFIMCFIRRNNKLLDHAFILAGITSDFPLIFPRSFLKKKCMIKAHVSWFTGIIYVASELTTGNWYKSHSWYFSQNTPPFMYCIQKIHMYYIDPIVTGIYLITIYNIYS